MAAISCCAQSLPWRTGSCLNFWGQNTAFKSVCPLTWICRVGTGDPVRRELGPGVPLADDTMTPAGVAVNGGPRNDTVGPWCAGVCVRRHMQEAALLCKSVCSAREGWWQEQEG